MQYTEILPSAKLKAYVKSYYLFEQEESRTYEDTVFPAGNIEMIFNLGNGQWQTEANGIYSTTPTTEFWGQLTKPLSIKSIGTHKMLGIRLYPHSAAYLLRGSVNIFNDLVTDLKDVMGKEIATLYAQLSDTTVLTEQITLIETFLLNRLVPDNKQTGKIAVVEDVLVNMKQASFSENIDTVAARYGITSRYLQQLFVQHTGIPPKLYSKINRFQHSLRLINRKQYSLTSIAYDSGYADQSHFIKEFKSFTGITPSAYLNEEYPVNQAMS
ncbi:MAG: AraC family transcriptional regulator [Filimonas sp.]|nr:AraC family transcriptional regulator [Filimonas sp.]